MCNGDLTQTGNSDKKPEETKTVPENSNNEFEKPKAPFNKFQWVGLLLAVVFAAAVSCVSIFGKENFDKYLIIMIFSITAVLFATIFYFIYKYRIISNDSIIEDYLKDKELYRQHKREKMKTGNNSLSDKELKEKINKIVNDDNFKNNIITSATNKLLENKITELQGVIQKIADSIEIKEGVNLNKNTLKKLSKGIDEIKNELDKLKKEQL